MLHSRRVQLGRGASFTTYFQLYNTLFLIPVRQSTCQKCYSYKICRVIYCLCNDGCENLSLESLYDWQAIRLLGVDTMQKASKHVREKPFLPTLLALRDISLEILPVSATGSSASRSVTKVQEVAHFILYDMHSLRQRCRSWIYPRCSPRPRVKLSADFPASHRFFSTVKLTEQSVKLPKVGYGGNYFPL